MERSSISRKIIVLAISAMGLAAPHGAAVAGNLDSSSIRKLFPGEFEAVVRGYRIHISGSAGGRLVGEAYGQQDRGRWYMKGNTLCVAWNKWAEGKSTCGKISQQSGWFVASGSGGQILKFRRDAVAGN